MTTAHLAKVNLIRSLCSHNVWCHCWRGNGQRYIIKLLLWPWCKAKSWIMPRLCTLWHFKDVEGLCMKNTFGMYSWGCIKKKSQDNHNHLCYFFFFFFNSDHVKFQRKVIFEWLMNPDVHFLPCWAFLMKHTVDAWTDQNRQMQLLKARKLLKYHKCHETKLKMNRNQEKVGWLNTQCPCFSWVASQQTVPVKSDICLSWFKTERREGKKKE